MFSKRKLFAAKLFAAAFWLTAVLAGGFTAASAQEKVKVSKEEAKAIEKIEKAKTVDEKMQQIAAFIKAYPQSPARKQVVEEAAAQISQISDNAQVVQQSENYLKIFTAEPEADLVLPGLIYSYVQLKRTKDAFDTAQAYLARHPEDVTTRLTLAIEGSNQVRLGNKDFAAPTRDFAATAVELIEADKRPASVTEARWQEYKTRWLPQLYQSLGILEFNSGDNAKARAYLEKSAALDPADLNNWILLGSMRDEEYKALAVKYNAAAPGAERDGLLKQANEKMDEVMELFARIVALTDGKPEAKQINDQVRENLESYYKYRHKNTDGMQALIDKYKK